MESTTNTVLYDSFNPDATGAAPSGWMIDTSGGTVTVQEDPSATDKSLLLTKSGTAGNVSSKRSFSAVSGKVNVEASVKTNVDASNTPNNWQNALYVADSSGNVAASIIFNNGYLALFDGSTITNVQAIQPNTWYYIKLVMDPATDTFDLYVNGNADDNVYTATPDVANVPFRTPV